MKEFGDSEYGVLGTNLFIKEERAVVIQGLRRYVPIPFHITKVSEKALRLVLLKLERHKFDLDLAEMLSSDC